MIFARASLLPTLAAAAMISLPSQAQIRPAPSTVPEPRSAPAPVPAPKSTLPPPVTFIARILRSSRPLPARLGGWTCAAPDCRLRTSGPATQTRMRELCFGLQELAEEHSIKLALKKLHAEERGRTGPTLDSGHLAACNRR